jgi:hypothetical protein
MASKILCRKSDISLASFSQRGMMFFRPCGGGVTTMAENFATDFYGCPEYVITHIRTEKLANGNTRVYHWENRNGLLVPSFMAFIATKDLVVMNGIVQETLNDYAPDDRLQH